VKYCHPAAVLKALSIVRFDKRVDQVSREAVIAVDVGDVTLVSSKNKQRRTRVAGNTIAQDVLIAAMS